MSGGVLSANKRYCMHLTYVIQGVVFSTMLFIDLVYVVRLSELSFIRDLKGIRHWVQPVRHAAHYLQIGVTQAGL